MVVELETFQMPELPFDMIQLFKITRLRLAACFMRSMTKPMIPWKHSHSEVFCTNLTVCYCQRYH